MAKENQRFQQSSSDFRTHIDTLNPQLTQVGKERSLLDLDMNTRQREDHAEDIQSSKHLQTIEMASESEFACTYAALILADDDVAVTGEKITTILKAADFQIEPFWPNLFARSLTGMNIKELIANIGAGAGAAPAGGGAAPSAEAAAEEKKGEKKEESEEESDDNMGFGLFD